MIFILLLIFAEVNKNLPYKKISGIYQIINWANGKRYIGQSINVKQRICEHRNSLRNGNHHNPHLQRSWKRYGEKYFSFELIEIYPREKLNEKETYWIRFFMSNDKMYGYNTDDGGNSMVKTDESKKRMSKAHRGHKQSPEAIEKQRLKITGRKLTDEHKEKIRQSNLGKKVSEEMLLKIKETKNKHAKLTEEIVLQVLDMTDKKIPYSVIAEKFNIGVNNIGNIKNGITWKHVHKLRMEERSKS